MGISNVHGELIYGFKPSVRQLPSEPIVTKEDIRNSLAFRPREPSSNQGIHQWQIGFDNKWSAGDDDHYALDSPTDVLDCARTWIWKCQIEVVSISFGIWGFPNHNNSIRESIVLYEFRIWILRVDNFARRVNSRFDCLKNSSTCINANLKCDFFEGRSEINKLQLNE